MAETHVISALVSKRSELLGMVEHYETLIKEHKENLLTIDKAILIFDRSYNLSAVKAKGVANNRYFVAGEARVLILEALKESTQALRTDEIAHHLCGVKSIELESNYERVTFQKSVVAALNRLEKEHLVEKAGRYGLVMLWRIKPLVA